MHGYGGAYVTIGWKLIPASVTTPQAGLQFGRLVHYCPSHTLGHGVPRSGRTWEFAADLGVRGESNPDCGDLDSNPLVFWRTPVG